MRRASDGKRIYVMYDTDRGSRMYVFFSEQKAGYMFADGFPILMKRKLTYQHFASLAVGQTLEQVRALDPVADVYQQTFDTADEVALEKWTGMGAPPTSLHLLSDGILKI